MSVSDPIADMLTRIRNAAMLGQNLVAMPNSVLKIEIAKILKEERLCREFSTSRRVIKPSTRFYA